MRLAGWGDRIPGLAQFAGEKGFLDLGSLLHRARTGARRGARQGDAYRVAVPRIPAFSMLVWLGSYGLRRVYLRRAWLHKV
jgi:hypothetical protein